MIQVIEDSMVMFDGTITYKNKELLPESSGVYFVFSGSELQYIGQSTNIRARFGYHHHRTSEFKHMKNLLIGWVLVPNGELLSTEKKYINLYTPKMNGKIGRPVESGAYRNPFPLRLNDEQLAHCQKMAQIHGHINAYIRHLIDQDISHTSRTSEEHPLFPWLQSGCQHAAGFSNTRLRHPTIYLFRF